jgi:hypothetical protein
MTNTAVLPIFHVGAESTQRSDPPFHGLWRRDAVPVAHGHKRRRLGRCEVRMPRVQEYEGRWLREIRSAYREGPWEPIAAAILAPAELPHSE